MKTREAGYKWVSYERITSLSTVKSITLDTAEKKKASAALIVAEGQAIWWSENGTDPSTTNGTPLPVNTYFMYTGDKIDALKFIEQAASAELHVTLYR